MKGWFTFFSGILIAVATANAVQITGKIIETSGGSALVKVDGTVSPAVGDSLEIFFTLPGLDDEISVATGTVTGVDADSTKVNIEKATGTVEKGQLVRFKPQSPDQPAITGTSPPAEASHADLQAAAALQRKGRDQRAAGDIYGAIITLTEAIRLAPDVAAFFYDRANAYYDKHDFQAVIADINKALELKVQQPANAYVLRGMAEASLGNFDASISDFTLSIQINPENALGYNNRANSKLRKQDYRGALADCDKALELNRDFGLAYANRGYAYFYLNNTTKALADWKKAVQLEPRFGADLNPKIRQLETSKPKRKK